MKIKNILLPYDGSEHSINAARYALELAKIAGAHVTIVNCYEWRLSISEVPSSIVTNLQENCRKEAEKLLEKPDAIFADQGVEYKLEAIDGSPSIVLTKMAKSKEFDLIIMGSHGHSDIAGLFLGSVTHKVLNTIYCPVMVVP
ncbi:universal stress protein [Desulforhopalus singaporensis]|uniref:Nucleotide-binding universal stress protein, UspA family n=1 Tax=Desulforhopalus singaporensis TaxID=91360 RepID=A0A1H0KRX5_9BACT|nr:universal stress protein [Desulforhopalus singaporensis]SDO58531.1 Nucleotide-binding universal stress protein, UspA family [Desulforhopalus singaporensis]